MSKNKQNRHITVSEMAPHVHVFLSGENKVNKISDWLINWIEQSLKKGIISPGDFLPSKGDLACHTGVSIGTVQNVFRLVEDKGYIESKQRIGTYIKEPQNLNSELKLTSKRDYASHLIIDYMIREGYKKGDYLISIRKLSSIINIPNATVRTAVNYLETTGVLKKVANTYMVNNLNINNKKIEAKTLVIKIAEKIKEMIKTEYKNGEKLPTNPQLAKKYNVSIKTIHDAIKILVKQGIVYTRRGQYGTIIMSEKQDNKLYSYEKAEQKIRQMIMQEYNVGDKLPSMSVLSKKYEVSSKTIKRALDNLQDEGYIMYTRGRFGGTIITDIPQASKEAYKWLAISSDYVSEIDN